MTGFGAADGPVAGGRLRVEVRSVNHRHLTVQLKVPSELGHLEADLRERVRAHLGRGSVTLTARWAEEPPVSATVTVDDVRAKAVVGALRAIGRELGIPGDVDLAAVARIPDVVRIGSAGAAVEVPEVVAVVDAAAAACVVMREREGRALGADLATRIEHLDALAGRVAERAPARLIEEQARLKRNVTELAGGVAVDPARLAQEIAFMADRLDITEELVRFRSHLAAVRGALGGQEPAGRSIGFLLQELGREANTIGSKAADAAITEAVIAMKGELERMREQVENLE
jgi:uncharacterized protein (TIGR00255 family)